MKKYIISLILILIPVCSFADQTPTGIPRYKDSFGTYFYPYTNFSISSLWGTITGHAGEIIYNTSGGSSTTAGWVDVRGCTRANAIVQILVPTYTSSGTITLYVEGRIGTSTGTGTVLLSINVNAAGNSTRVITEDVDWMRIGQTITSLGTESVSVVLRK